MGHTLKTSTSLVATRTPKLAGDLPGGLSVIYVVHLGRRVSVRKDPGTTFIFFSSVEDMWSTPNCRSVAACRTSFLVCLDGLALFTFSSPFLPSTSWLRNLVRTPGPASTIASRSAATPNSPRNFAPTRHPQMSNSNRFRNIGLPIN